MKLASIITAGLVVAWLGSGLRAQTAKAGPAILRVPESVMASRVVAKVALDRTMTGPDVNGTVVLSEVVNRDGFIEHISVLSGPQPARAAAVFAARQWSYKPYLVDGHPVPVETTATLQFGRDDVKTAPISIAEPIVPAPKPTYYAPPPQMLASAHAPEPLPASEHPAYRVPGGPHAPVDAQPVFAPRHDGSTLLGPARWTITRRVAPVYPAAAEQAGVEGVVVVEGIVKRDGTLHGLSAVSGPNELRQAALDAAAEWKFGLVQNGEPQDTPVREPIEFLLKGPAHVPADVMAGRIERSVQPEYPADAQAAGVTGSVLLHVLVGRQGEVKRAAAVSGPAMLRESALAAVKQWTWKPYLRNGVDQEVETDVVVAFTMQWAGVQ